MSFFSDRLKDLQGEMNTSEFARFLCVKQQTLDNYMRGRSPNVEFVIAVCEKCGVSADWFLGISGKETNGGGKSKAGKKCESRKISALRSSLRSAVQAAENFAKIVKDLEKEL